MGFAADFLTGRPWAGYTRRLEAAGAALPVMRFPRGRPLVSVIIPTKNSARTLALCLTALRSQTYPRIEVLVNDDRSTDGTPGIARRLGAKLLTINRGMAQGRNSAVPRARGRYLFHVDSDMELTPRVVEECVWLCETKGYDALIVPEVSVASTYWGRCRALEKLTFLGDPFMEVANRFMRRSAFEAVGGFDETLMAGEDFDFFERLKALGLAWGRCTSVIRHHELPSLRQTLAKCVRYGRTFRGYIAKHPARSGMQFSPLRPAYLRRAPILLLDPAHLVGLITMKSLMYLFTAYGLAISLTSGNAAKSPLPTKIFVAAHTTRIYGPVQALTAWLRRARADFTLAALPFAYSGLPHAVEQRFTAGRPTLETPGHASRGWEPWLWVKDWCFVLRRGWRAGAGTPVDLFIGVDCLNASAGLLLRSLGRARRVAFYVIDYTPKRFKNPVLNAVYAWVDRLAATRSDLVWNLSERMRDVRRGQGVDEGRNRLVPVGVELGKVVHVPRAKVKRRSLLYMGALMDDKGLQLMVEAFPEVLRRVPDAELHILGFGPFEDELKRLVQASPARARIRVPGGLAHDALFKTVPAYGVALAPYLDDPGSYTWWCDPTKPKEYLACGLPIIITRVPWIWERVADPRKPLGLAIDYKRDELVKACVRLLKDDRYYWRCRRNALEFAATLDWDGIYNGAFEGLGQGAP